MTRLVRLLYCLILAAFGAIVLLALAAGWWIFALPGAIFTGLFAFAAPWVLGARWRPPAPRPTRRPVVRRRR